ncbi:MAG: ABC transporter permease [Bacteroidales bacterium]|nr:ABC transporter permease [Bacteroidales bacterium]
MFKIFLKKDFWEYVWVFTWRELKIKYTQTYIGVFWMIFPPFMALFIASFFFGNLLKGSAQISNYTLFAYCGMMGWYYFSYLITYTSISLIQNMDIIHKANMPVVVIPLSRALLGLFDVIIWLLIAIIVKIFMGIQFNISNIFILIAILLNFITGFSIGIWLAILSVRWRDIYQVIPYIIGLTMLITPIFYHVNMVPSSLKVFVYLNPVAGVIEIYRKHLVYSVENIYSFVPGFLMAAFLLVIGLWYFFKHEKQIAETL